MLSAQQSKMFPFECNKFTKLQYRSAASAVSLLALVVVVSLALSATAVAFYLRLRIVFSDKMIAMLPNFYFQKVCEGADIQQRPYYTSTSAIFRDKSIMRDFSALHRPVKQHTPDPYLALTQEDGSLGTVYGSSMLSFKQFWEGIVFLLVVCHTDFCVKPSSSQIASDMRFVQGCVFVSAIFSKPILALTCSTGYGRPIPSACRETIRDLKRQTFISDESIIFHDEGVTGGPSGLPRVQVWGDSDCRLSIETRDSVTLKRNRWEDATWEWVLVVFKWVTQECVYGRQSRGGKTYVG